MNVGFRPSCDARRLQAGDACRNRRIQRINLTMHGNGNQKSQCRRIIGLSPLPSLPIRWPANRSSLHRDNRFCHRHRLRHPKPGFLKFGDRLRKIADTSHRNVLDGTGRGFGHGGVQSDGTPHRNNNAVDPRRISNLRTDPNYNFPATRQE